MANQGRVTSALKRLIGTVGEHMSILSSSDI